MTVGELIKEGSITVCKYDHDDYDDREQHEVVKGILKS